MESYYGGSFQIHAVKLDYEYFKSFWKQFLGQ